MNNKEKTESEGAEVMKKLQKTAFTLAEVLVTLAIIGVVSALTVPGLMNSYQKQTYITQLHKVYNEMSQALTQYKTDRNAINLFEAGLNSQENADTFIETYFKVINKCDTMAPPCFANASEYKTLAGTSAVIGSGSTSYKTYTLASGAAIRPLYRLEGEKLINVLVDINGTKGPNIMGRDFFWLGIYNNGMIDDYSATASPPLSSTTRETLFTTYCQKGTGAEGCFGKILNDNWQMTY